MTCNTVYYRAVGGEPLAFCKAWLERQKNRAAELNAWAATKGAVGFTYAGRGEVTGCLFDSDPPAPWKAAKRPSTDGRTVYRGHGGTKEGKALNREIAALAPLPSDDEFAVRFGVPTGLKFRKSDTNHGGCTLMPFFFTACKIGWERDQFWVVTPDVAAAVRRYEEDGYTVTPSGWIPPDGLELSSRKKYDLERLQREIAEEEAA